MSNSWNEKLKWNVSLHLFRLSSQNRYRMTTSNVFTNRQTFNFNNIPIDKEPHLYKTHKINYLHKISVNNSKYELVPHIFRLAMIFWHSPAFLCYVSNCQFKTVLWQNCNVTLPWICFKSLKLHDFRCFINTTQFFYFYLVNINCKYFSLLFDLL